MIFELTRGRTFSANKLRQWSVKLTYLPSSGKYLFKEHQIFAGQLAAKSSSTWRNDNVCLRLFSFSVRYILIKNRKCTPCFFRVIETFVKIWKFVGSCSHSIYLSPNFEQLMFPHWTQQKHGNFFSVFYLVEDIWSMFLRGNSWRE